VTSNESHIARPVSRVSIDAHALSQSAGRLAAVIVVLHVALALVWSVVVPIGEGPDEPGHFNYALFLLREGRLPVQGSDPAESDVPGEGHQPPLAYWLMQPAVRSLPEEQRALEMGANPRFIWNGGDEPNAFFRSSRDVWPFSGTARAWHLARGISALLGGLTVALVYLTARRAFPALRWLALGAAAIVALNPQFIFAHALVSNDPLLITLTSAMIYLCAALATPRAAAEARPYRGWWLMALSLGLVLGLMLITKQSALLFAPLPLIAIVVSRALSARQRLMSLLIVPATALVASGWWFARNARLYGDVFGLAAFQEVFAAGAFEARSWESWRAGLWNLLRSSWGMFGWMTLPLPDGAHRAFGIILALAVIGLVASVSRGWWRDRGRLAIVLGAAVILACVWTVAFALTAGAVAWQGRFLFPAAAAIATLLAAGLGAVLPGRSALLTLAAVQLILAITLPRGLIAPAYESYVLPPQPDDWGNVYGRFSFDWKQGVELRDVQMPAEAFTGDTIDMTLTWHALEQMDRPWTVFIILVDEGKQVVSERNAEPLNGAFPMSSWVAGDWIRDPKQVLITAPPGSYRVWIGVWDPNEVLRLAMYDRNGDMAGDRVEPGRITIRSRQ
jgi:4-amino-4-deoxy-L-arabinose transferase-like glycosyltransferase